MIAPAFTGAFAAAMLLAAPAAGQSAFHGTSAPETPIKTDTAPMSEDETRQAIRAVLLVGWGGVYDELAYGFSQDYLTFETDLVRRYQAGGVSDEDMAGLAYDFYAGLKDDYELGLASAPTRLMGQLQTEDAKLMEAVRAETWACIELIETETLSPASLDKLTEAQQLQFRAYSTARARALKAGVQTPVQHPASTDDDVYASLAAYLQVGGKKKLAEAALDEKKTISDQERCDFITDYTRGVATLPADSIARIRANN